MESGQLKDGKWPAQRWEMTIKKADLANTIHQGSWSLHILIQFIWKYKWDTPILNENQSNIDKFIFDKDNSQKAELAT